MIAALVVLPAALTRPAAAAIDPLPERRDVHIVWNDAFSNAEQVMLTVWIEETCAAVEGLVGPFPMPVRVFMHRREDTREPVPWANTQRWRGQGVHFHVDPTYPLERFRHDWTAPHELSHLILPYLGRRHAWFAEGFASFMQYRVMQAMGVLTAAEATQRYLDNLERAARTYLHPRESFVEAAPKLRATRQFRAMYWGGAAYFLQVDAALEASGSSLTEVLGEYLHCCRRNRDGLHSLLVELDRLSASKVFTEHYAAFASEPGFPRFEP